MTSASSCEQYSVQGTTFETFPICDILASGIVPMPNSSLHRAPAPLATVMPGSCHWSPTVCEVAGHFGSTACLGSAKGTSGNGLSTAVTAHGGSRVADSGGRRHSPSQDGRPQPVDSGPATDEREPKQLAGTSRRATYSKVNSGGLGRHVHHGLVPQLVEKTLASRHKFALAPDDRVPHRVDVRVCPAQFAMPARPIGDSQLQCPSSTSSRTIWRASGARTSTTGKATSHALSHAQ